MLRNYITIALRSLTRTKVHTAINVTGLSVGICSCLLIALFVQDELTFDKFHSKADRIYRVYAIEDWGENQRFIDVATPFPMGPALKEHLEEVEYMARIQNIGTQVKIGSEIFSESATIVGVDFLKIFDFDLVAGQKENMLGDPTNVVLTESTARQFFGEINPLGKTLSILINNYFQDFTVTGVLKDPPSNSSIQFETLLSDLIYPKLYSPQILTSAWFNIAPETYVQLKPDVALTSCRKSFLLCSSPCWLMTMKSLSILSGFSH